MRIIEELMMKKKLTAIAKQAMVGILVSMLLVLGGIEVLLLIQTCTLWGASLGAMERPNYGGDQEGNEDLKREALQKLPRYEFGAGEEDSMRVECAVCLDNFEVGDDCRLLPACTHSFHAYCVDNWLLRSWNCPVCRTPAGGWS
ncbi:RING-H2 finger protein ATL74-like [Canna indica]|uniref:RING-H2 finger protein ATL74-like n=1 Tax=Canna indica TaxID=4628 RepID=A0AAQ3QTB6_9LILI|nr:RING-H2 finger protein ATL74-like [Canna indica]